MALLVLVGCGRGAGTDRPAASGLAGADAIPCAIDTAPLAPQCSVERADTSRARFLTLRRPDGGFPRLLVTTDGHGVIAAEGAAPARASIVGPAGIEVAFGQEGYRLPATVGRERSR